MTTPSGRLPLEGIRILDSTYVFALPYAGGLLADLGAEVIKIEGPTRPDTTRSGLFWPSTLSFDGRWLWVGEFKFSGRIVGFEAR